MKILKNELLLVLIAIVGLGFNGFAATSGVSTSETTPTGTANTNSLDRAPGAPQPSDPAITNPPDIRDTDGAIQRDTLNTQQNYRSPNNKGDLSRNHLKDNQTKNRDKQNQPSPTPPMDQD